MTRWMNVGWGNWTIDENGTSGEKWNPCWQARYPRCDGIVSTLKLISCWNKEREPPSLESDQILVGSHHWSHGTRVECLYNTNNLLC